MYSPATIGVEFAIKMYPELGIKLQLWDTCGTTRFRAITRSYYRGANIAFLVFDLSLPDDINCQYAPQWFSEILSNKCPVGPISERATYSQSDDFAVVVIGNKKDLVSDEVAERSMSRVREAVLATRPEEVDFPITFHLTSALKNEGVATVFDGAVTRVSKYSAGMDRSGGVLLPSATERIPRKGQASGCTC